ncbi:response regulator transcription factor [Parafrigoribacterium humi]|jgi:DNA-binding NarL/FixJ family response regulator|uniref:response regulator transcription factor n=1 Tax=Parafrigoribacterium humi TaxID=3144664 RepID=UPI0032EF1172
MTPPHEEGAPRIRVAVIDDHRLVLDGLVAHLAAHHPGIEVVISEASWPALLAHRAFPVDVVVLDLSLDDHIPIGTKIRALTAAGSRTIVMSRHADMSTIYSAVQAGALGFIPKTETADALVAAIRSAAAGMRYDNEPLLRAMSGTTPGALPGLGRREQRALVLYASGRTIREVSSAMGTTDETVKSYIKRARRKYRDAGMDLGSKIKLRDHGIRVGWVPKE